MSSFIEFTTIALVLVYIGVAAMEDLHLPHHLGQHWRVLRIPDRRVLHSPGGLLGATVVCWVVAIAIVLALIGAFFG